MTNKASAPPAGGKRRRKIGAPKVRLEEVAQEAGVSAATASRVLNNPSLVTKDLREKVLKATSKLAYVAHGAARALASRRSRVLGAVVPNLSNTIFSDMIEGFQQRLEPQGYTMLLATFNYDEAAEFRSVRTMIERGVDGLVLVGVTHSKELELLLKSSGIPFVQTWAPASSRKPWRPSLLPTHRHPRSHTWTMTRRNAAVFRRKATTVSVRAVARHCQLAMWGHHRQRGTQLGRPAYPTLWSVVLWPTDGQKTTFSSCTTRSSRQVSAGLTRRLSCSMRHTSFLHGICIDIKVCR